MAEALRESRNKFKLHVESKQMFNLMDREAITMVEAQKQLEGVVVSDPEKVLTDFRNNRLFRPAPGEDDYDLLGKVPKVNAELAKRYIEMREIARRRQLFEQTQQKTVITESSQVGSKTTRSNRLNARRNVTKKPSSKVSDRLQVTNAAGLTKL